MPTIKISREQKNNMRMNLEEVVGMHKELEKKISVFSEHTEPEEYRKFWQELLENNRSTVRKITNFMVRKCNR
ncbi:hypothetical protein [Thermosyntropha sp.]|uniref:hypothetical protein n=1 Tax=Thermosyntropha sp. TaxID=2740820 RepID=UPI0025E03620|nr:hypothetical protein [Thermosyntropha sp.]MBO8159797.1 hypothetical protein [Thermosyntropha sp.]